MSNINQSSGTTSLPEDTQGLPLRVVRGSMLLVTSLFFLNFVTRVCMGPLMPRIEVDLAIDHAQAGSLFLSLSFGYCVGLLLSSLVASRITHRSTIALSSVCAGGFLLAISLGTTLGSLHLGLGGLGIASGLYLPSGIATITGLVRSADWGKALAIHELAPNLSFISAPLLTELLLKWLPWRGVMGTLGVAGMGAGLVFFRYGRGGREKGVTPGPTAVWAALRDPRLLGLMLLFSLAVGATLGIYTMLPLYLVSEAGWDRVEANTLLACSRLSGLVIVFVTGWLTDRLGSTRTMALALGATGAMTVLLGVSSGIALATTVFLQPMLAVCFFPVGFAALSRVSPLGVSLAVPVAMLLGAGGIPALLGWLAETGSFGVAMVMVGLLILGGALLSFFVGGSRPAGAVPTPATDAPAVPE
jgi:NNP family nitrate/nitrite transporter-like MFS transporter